MIVRPVVRSVSKSVTRAGILTTGTVFDFQKNRYAKDGKAVYLDDVSEFIRLSSATKWHDEKLVEVQENTPRISSAGLLVEKSATELIPNNSTMTSTRPTWVCTTKTDQDIGDVFEFVSDGYCANIQTSVPIQPNGNVVPNSGLYYRAILAKKTVDDSFLSLGSGAVDTRIIVNLKNGSIEYVGARVTESKISVIGEYYRIETLAPAEVGNMRQFYSCASDDIGDGSTLAAPTIGHKVTIAFPAFMDTVDFPQSIVRTSGTQVTRSPDILNVPLLPTQTITGDWDEGVTHSVADGIATFTGHGYIRNITVETL